MLNRNGIPIVDPKPRCPGKDHYGTRSEADGYAAFFRYRGTRRRLRSYWCRACRSWHLTGQSNDVSRERSTYR